MPKISVLVPIFNVEKFLRECLDTVAGQTLEDIEIICINDGSTDSSLDIIQSYAVRDPRFKVIDKANSGYGDSMNRGLELATGEYIGIVESDDWAELDMFERLYDLAKEFNADVAKSNFYSYYEAPEKSALSGQKVEVVHPEEEGMALRTRDHCHIMLQQPAIWSAIYRRKFLNDNDIRFLPTPGASYQDTGFAFKVYAQANRVVFTKEAFLHYRRDNEASSVSSPGKVFCVSDEYEEIQRYLIEHGIMDDLADIFELARLGGYMWNIDRLDPDLADQFIDHISAEIGTRELHREMLDVNHIRTLEELVNSPETAKARRRAQAAAKVTAIVPTHNDEDFIEQCLDSILNQTLKELELIIVDDGSKDDSIHILEEYYKRDPRVRLVNIQNSGQGASRNLALGVAHAPWVSFVDADDWLELDAFENLLHVAERDEAQLAMGRILLHFEKGTRTAVERVEDERYYRLSFEGPRPLTPYVLEHMDLSPCNKLFSRELIEDLGLRFPHDLKFEDAYFVNAICWMTDKITFLPNNMPVYNYRRRASSTMANTFTKGARAGDHMDIGFRLLDVMERIPEVKQKLWGKYYVRILQHFINFSFFHSPGWQIPALWRQLGEWIEYNYDKVAAYDTQGAEEIFAPIPDKFLPSGGGKIGGLTGKLRRKAKTGLWKVLPSYRAASAVLRRLDILSAQLEQVGKHLDSNS